MSYIEYCRVSTAQQGASGLGLEAQQAAVRSLIKAEPVATYIEVESGGKNDRKALREALSHAKAGGHGLVVAKIDRLTRDLRFLLEVLDSGVEIKFVEMPEANRFMLSVMGAVAELERKMISERTKAALAAAKARGVKLGGYRATRRDGTPRKDRTPTASRLDRPELVAQVKQLRQDGLSMDAIADRLNEQGVTAPRGGALTRSHIHRILTK